MNFCRIIKFITYKYIIIYLSFIMELFKSIIFVKIKLKKNILIISHISFNNF